MTTITVFCVSIEDDDSGLVDWYYKREDAEREYLAAIADPDWKGQEINLWAQEVEDDDAITYDVDAAMWDRGYEPLRWRKGEDHSALPHAKPPTD